MENNTPGILQQPEELHSSERLASEDKVYEKYNKDGIYSYRLLPNGKKDKSELKISYYEGDVFEGTLKRGKYEGEGKYTWADGSHYEGTFSGGKLFGKGQFISSNGDVYEGSFKNGAFEGEGKYTWADGSSFVGVFHNGQLKDGKYVDSAGNEYACHYNFKRNGQMADGTVTLLRTSATVKEEKKLTQTTEKKSANNSSLLSKDTTLLTAIRKSARGAEFKELYSGSVLKGEKADKRLLTILDFFTNSNPEQMERIFKASKLYDGAKGDSYVSDMVSDVVKDSKAFVEANSSKAQAKLSQSKKQSQAKSKKSAAAH